MLGAEEWGVAAIRSRMGLHCGEAEERGGDYFGTAVNRAARVMAAGHGGQVIATQAFAEVAGPGQLVDLGEHRLRDLTAAQRIYQVGDGEFPTLRSLDAYPTNLPQALSSFIGRGEEVRSIAGDVVDHRLVTLSGTGGVGKTRMAAQVCADVLPHFPDGAWFVELAPLRTGTQIPLAIAAACQIPQRPGEALEVMTVFARLAVFRGSFDLAAAEAVVAGDGIDDFDVVDLVERLVDKSMVATVPSAGTARYRQLETLRQFAQERLVASGEVDALRERHEAYYRTLADEWAPRLKTADQVEGVERLHVEFDNLEAILERMLEDGRIAAMARLHLTLVTYWGTKGSNAGRFWTEALLEQSDEIDDEWLRLEFAAAGGFTLYSSGAWRRAGEVLAELEHVVGDDLVVLGVEVLFSKAALALEDQRHDDLVRAADWALQAAQIADDPWGQMLASSSKLNAVLVTDPVAGLRAAQEHHDAVGPYDIPMLTGAALDQLGVGFWQNHRRAEAADAFRRAIDAAGDVIPNVAMFGLIGLGVLAAEDCKPDALPILARSFSLYRDHPVEPGSIVGALLAVAFVLDDGGRTAEAATCVGAATALQDSLGLKGQLLLQKQVGVVVDRVTQACADPEIAAAEQRGREMSQDEFCRFVLDLDPIA